MARVRISTELAVAVVSSMALHALWLARDARASHVRETAAAELMFEVAEAPKPPEPPPAPEPPPEEAPRASAPKAPQPVVARAPAAPPPAARAGKTLTAPETADDPSAPADFTMVQGLADAYAGGTTSALGTSAKAVHGPASDRPVAGPIGRAEPAAPVGPDRSRAATPAANDWNCSRLFPSDPEAGDQAAVLIAVTVTPDGTPKSVTVLRDPGHGFGAAARACAMVQRFHPAFDRSGRAILATTPPITVRFSR